MIPDFLDRTALLLGEDALERLQNAHVLVLGLGGVGSWAAEFLLRGGIGRLTLVDGDIVESSNRNRQLPALISTLGQPKATVLAERLRDINPKAEITPIVRFIADGATRELLETPFDYAIDAIDSLSAKVHFILECKARNIPLVSSMGSGGRVDPAQITIADIAKTDHCRLARAVRQQLRRHGFAKGLKVVYSPEHVPDSAVRPPLHPGERSCVGTISYIPAIFGGHLASVVLRDLAARDIGEMDCSVRDSNG